MKKNNLVLSVTAVIFAHIVYLIWLPFPKSFWKSLGSSGFISDFITNIIYFSAFAVILIVSIGSATQPVKSLSSKSFFVSIVAVLCAELCFDFIELIIERIYPTWAQIPNDFFTLLKEPLLIVIVCKALSMKSVKWKRFCVIIVPCFITALTVLLVFDIRDIRALKYISDKYLLFSTESTSALEQLDTSSVWTDISSNLRFMYEIRNGIFDNLILIAAITALYCSVSPDSSKKDFSSWVTRARLFSRIAIALLLSFVFCWLKIIILPHNALIFASGDSSQNNGKGFYFDSNTVSVHRVQNRSDKKQVFCESFFTLYYDDKKISMFRIDGEYSSVVYEKKGSLLYVEDNWDKIDIDGTEVIACYDKLIAYLKDNAPQVIKFKDLKNYDYDEILLEACKQFVSRGEMVRFEYVYPYLMKYSPEFIKPYLERYSAGDFTENEKAQMRDINPEYLINCAERALCS